MTQFTSAPVQKSIPLSEAKKVLSACTRIVVSTEKVSGTTHVQWIDSRGNVVAVGTHRPHGPTVNRVVVETTVFTGPDAKDLLACGTMA